MRSTKKRVLITLLIFVILICALSVSALAADDDGYESRLFGSIWSLLPPVIAIVLALVTKEVYSSLAIGIISGALLYADFNPVFTLTTMFSDGLIASLADEWNVGILLFLVILGSIVVLVNMAGGSVAYGQWAMRKIKTRAGAQLATFVLGVLIFIDDYFNCLTVGNVMRPVTDSHKVSRAKLAYLVDSTAAPICMIAPISSWAAAVAGVAGFSGLTLFIKAIPYNFYSLLTLLTVVIISIFSIEFGPMRKHEDNAMLRNDLHSTDDRPDADASETAVSTRGKVIDLILPVIVLIITCIAGMIYTGGFFDGVSFVDSFAESDPSLGLPMGSFIALLFAIIYFLCRKVLSFKQCMSSIPSGFKAMVPAILILTFAWTLSKMTGLLGAAEYVAEALYGNAGGLSFLLPAIVFVVAVILSFATGTSWGTFGILIPIVVGILDPADEMLVITVSACLAGAVCGDHCSPISDTTIMSSAGAQCNHINHVSTQLPYALVVAAVSFVTYIIAGAVKSPWISLPIGIVLMLAVLFIIKAVTKNKAGTAKTVSDKS